MDPGFEYFLEGENIEGLTMQWFILQLPTLILHSRTKLHTFSCPPSCYILGLNYIDKGIEDLQAPLSESSQIH